MNKFEIEPQQNDGEFEMDWNVFFKDFIVPIMNAKPGTLAYEVRDDWARVAVEINQDKL